VLRPLLCVFAIAACSCASAPSPGASRSPTEGAIGGLANDRDSRDPVAQAQIRIRAQGDMTPRQTISNQQGIFGFDRLKPGRYSLSALFAGQPVEISNIDVKAGEATIVDVTFTLGDPTPITIDWNDPEAVRIVRFKPRVLSHQLAIIEGTVSDSATRGRVAGAAVMATGSDGTAHQGISDEQGRYRIEVPAPATYNVSAYYSVGSRQIEVRRSVEALAGEGVIVPLVVETAR